MSNALTFILKLQDMLTPSMRQAAAISNTSAAKIEGKFAKISAGGKKMGASVNELHARLDAINKVRFSTTIEREFNTATKAAQKLENQIAKLDNKGSKGGGGMLGGLVAGVSIAAIGQEAFSQAANAENQQIAFKVLTGSKKEGDALYNNISKMADSTPFESQDLGRSAKTMLGFGVDKKQIMPTLGMLGDISAAADDPAGSLQSLSLAFGQIAAKGHLAGGETLQMINAGFNPLKEISDMTGISMEKLGKAQEKGAISTDMVRAAMQHATGPAGKFHDMMKEQSQTLGGKWSTFMDGVHHKLRELGTILTPIANKVMEFGTDLMAGEGPALAIAIAIGGIALAMGWASLATGGLSIATGVLNAIMATNPIILIIALLIALGVWIYSVAKKYEGWGTSIQAVWEIIKAFGQQAWIPYKVFAENAWYYVQKLWLKMEDFAQSISQTFEKVGKAWELAKGGDFTGAKAALSANVQTQASQEMAALEIKHKTNLAGYASERDMAMKSMHDNALKIGLHKIPGAKKADAVTENGATDNKIFSGLDVLGGGGADAKGKSESINSGGQRSIIVNIAKQIEKLEVHVLDAKGGADEIESMVREAMRRVMYSINGVATS